MAIRAKEIYEVLFCRTFLYLANNFMKKYSLFILLISFSCYSQSSLLSTAIGDVINIKFEKATINFTIDNCFAQLSCYNKNTIRVRVSKEKFTTDESFCY